MFVHVLCYTENTIASDMEQATGLERKELEALMQGKEVIPIDAHYAPVVISFKARLTTL